MYTESRRRLIPGLGETGRGISTEVRSSTSRCIRAEEAEGALAASPADSLWPTDPDVLCDDGSQNSDSKTARYQGSEEDACEEDDWGMWTVKKEDADQTCDMSSEAWEDFHERADDNWEFPFPVMSRDRRTRISKALSFVLRHGAPSQGVRLDREGYGHVMNILESPAVSLLRVTLPELHCIVSSDDKNRFAAKTVLDRFYVKANEGHSLRGLDVEVMHTPVTIAAGNVPEVGVHGTMRKHLPSIRARGLLAGGLRGTREHVHLQSKEIGDDRVVSGMRADCEIAVYIDIPAALRDGVVFLLSANGVLLTPGVRGVLAARYITSIVDLGSRRRL